MGMWKSVLEALVIQVGGIIHQIILLPSFKKEFLLAIAVRIQDDNSVYYPSPLGVQAKKTLLIILGADIYNE